MTEKEYHLHGSFLVLEARGRYLFLKREDNCLFELLGGGFNSKETNHQKVLLREIEEEAGIQMKNEQLIFCAVLGQRLKKEIISYYDGKTEVGFVFVHTASIDKDPEHIPITLSSEHTDYRWFTHEEIIESYQIFSSGPLWMWFSFLEFQRTGITQQGKLYDRRIWQGKEYASL